MYNEYLIRFIIQVRHHEDNNIRYFYKEETDRIG